MKSLVQFLTLAPLETFAGRPARTWRLPVLLLAVLALTFANAGADELAGTVRITSGDGSFAAISPSNKTLTVPAGTSLTGNVHLHTTNEGSPNWIAPLIFTPSWGNPSTSYQTINDWISTSPSDYQAAVSVIAPSVPGVYHVIFAYFWEIGADHVASGTNWQVGADIWDDGDEIARLNSKRIAEAQQNGFTVAPRLVTSGSELFNTPADAVTLIVTAPPTTWDLAAGWSDSANPNGVWAYREGNNELPATEDWFHNYFGSPQPAWAYAQEGSGTNYIPAWMKMRFGFAPLLKGDVLVHSTDGGHGIGNGPGNVTWTSPIAGKVTISGNIWEFGITSERTNHWTLSVKGVELTSGDISVNNSSRNAPFAFESGTAGASVLRDIAVAVGDVVKLEFTETSPPPGNGDFVGVNLTVTKSRVIPTLRGDVAGEPAGTKFASFGTPQVGAFSATISKGKVVSSVIIGPDGQVPLRAAGSVPGLAGSVITKLGQPSGDALMATLRISAAHNITARNNVVLVSGLSSGSPQVAVQTGTTNAALPAGVTIKSFGAIDGTGSGLFFLATLQGNGVTPKNASALCMALGDGSVKVLARVGDGVNGKTIATIGTLVGSAGTLSEGRWRVDETTCGVRLTFAGAAKEQALFAIPGTATTTADWTLLAHTGLVGNIAALNGAKIKSLGLPGFGRGAAASFLANLAITPGGPTAANHLALLKGTAGSSPIVLARTGDIIAADANGAPLAGARIASMLNPIAGADGKVAFTMNTVRADGLLSRGIMYRKAGQTPTLLANVGALAPSGGHWSALGELALPDGTNGGPVFRGTLAVNGADGVTTKNNAGLWAMDSGGTLRLVLRTNQSVIIGGVTKTLRSFTGLLAAPSSIGAASTYDNTGRIAVLATFTDGTRALLTVEIP